MDVFTSTPAYKGGRGKALDRSRRNRSQPSFYLAATEEHKICHPTQVISGRQKVQCHQAAFMGLLAIFLGLMWQCSIR